MAEYCEQAVERAQRGSVADARQLVGAAILHLRSHAPENPGLGYVAEALVGVLEGIPLALGESPRRGVPGYNHRAIGAAWALLVRYGLSLRDAKVSAAAAMGCSVRTAERARKTYGAMMSAMDPETLELLIPPRARQIVLKFCR